MLFNSLLTELMPSVVLCEFLEQESVRRILTCCLLFADSGFLFFCSDTNAYIWSVAKPTKNIAIKNCHANGVNGVCWLDDASAATAGADGSVKIVSEQDEVERISIHRLSS